MSNRMAAPSIRCEKAWAAATAAAAAGMAAALFHDFWTPAVFLAGHDTYTHDYLMWEWGWQSLVDRGRVPLWNPYLFGGWPFVASFAFCPFYPPAWLSVGLRTSLALTSQYALHLAIGAVGFYAFARAMRVQPLAACFVAILYETGAHVATLAFPGHLAKLQAIAWIGWAMAAALMLARSGRLRWGVALGAAWALQILASHAQIFYATFWMSALFVLSAALYRLIRGKSDRRVSLLRPIGGLALAGLVCAGLSAVQMLPGLEMGRISNRSEGFDLAAASSHALPAEELWEFALPSFLGDSTGNLAIRGRPLPYLGKWNAPEGGEIGERLVSDYVGLAALIFAACSLVGSRARKKWFFAAAAVVGLLISTGEATPLFSWAHRWAPGFNRFRSPAAFMVVAHFSLFALAALGLQREIEILSRRRLRPPRWLAIGVTLFLTAAASAIVLVTVRTLPTIEGISLQEWRKIVSRPWEFRAELREIASLRALCHVACYFGVPLAASCLLAV
ncbi:MAG TPA: hypothetical protein VM492_15915, partial [Sumerlaeia bacterium]|nr:hypothetical protein [Sumerlaeia bacterium]